MRNFPTWSQFDCKAFFFHATSTELCRSRRSDELLLVELCNLSRGEGWAKSGENQVKIRSKSGENQVLNQVRVRYPFSPRGWQIRSKSGPNQVQNRSRPDFDPISTRFRPDFDPAVHLGLSGPARTVFFFSGGSRERPGAFVVVTRLRLAFSGVLGRAGSPLCLQGAARQENGSLSLQKPV